MKCLCRKFYVQGPSSIESGFIGTAALRQFQKLGALVANVVIRPISDIPKNKASETLSVLDRNEFEAAIVGDTPDFPAIHRSLLARRFRKSKAWKHLRRKLDADVERETEVIRLRGS
jgi:hypothetical protein